MDDTIAGPSSVSASAVREKQKIGHRRIDRQGEVSYKKVPTNALMGAIQLGISNSIGFVQQRPVRDLLLQDFAIIEHANFPSEGSLSTPSHSFGNFSFKTYAPLAFRHFREMFNIKPADFLRSLCTEPLRELSNPGASGSIFYVSMDDCFIIKTVQHKEAELLQKLLPGYFMNFHQNPKTLLPKFFGLFCYQSLGKNIRLLVMNNLLPQVITMHEKYDLKGSTYKRLASAREKQKSSPTLKDLDFIDNHPQGILVEAHAYEELISTFKKDCLVLESFKIMDYSLLVGIHNIEQAERTARAEREQEKTDERPCVLKLATGQLQEPGASYSSDRNEESSKSNSKKADRSVVRWESEQRYEEAAILGAVPARNTAGDRLLLFLGIIDILQNYRLLKKLEHTWKSVLHDGDSISVHNPSFYKKRFIDFCTEHVFKKAPGEPTKSRGRRRKEREKEKKKSESRSSEGVENCTG